MIFYVFIMPQRHSSLGTTMYAQSGAVSWVGRRNAIHFSYYGYSDVFLIEKVSERVKGFLEHHYHKMFQAAKILKKRI
jgi:hypothetical protein